MKTNKKILTAELLLVVILALCTLFHLTNSKYFTAALLTIAAALILYVFNRKPVLKKNRKKVMKIILIFALLYVALFYMMGLYSGFYRSSTTFGLKTILNYIIPITIIIIATELIRSRLLIEKSKKSRLLIFIFGTIVDISIYRSIYNLEYLDSFLAFLGIITFASIANNLLFNYISENYGAKPVIIYKLITTLYVYFIPFIPNVYGYLRTFLRMLYPLIIFMYIDKYYYEDKYRASPQEERKKIISIIITSIIVLMVIGLVSCKFLYGVLVIGSESMTGAIDKGDAVVFKQTNEIKEGDVIVFHYEDIKIVHRVIAAKNINGEMRYYTKGDANQMQDEGYVTKETLMGKVLFKIRYIGRPTLWLHDIFK